MSKSNSKYQRCRPLTDQEHEEEIRLITERGDLDSEFDLSDEDDSIDDPNHFDVEENVSEVEDNLELVEEEAEDYVQVVAQNVDAIDDEGADAEQEQQPKGDQYKAKSGKLWQKNNFTHSRRRIRNIVTEVPGLTRYSAAATTILDTFNLFVTKEMKEKICLHTNEEASRVYNAYNEEHPDNKNIWMPLAEVELNAFIGILISAGALRCSKENTTEMWTTDESIRRAIFTASMSRDRFVSIRTFLRFDDKITREERRATDKLAGIRELWDDFVETCKKSYIPRDTITVDEQLVGFRGKCPFRQYMKSKPAKYGIKIWAAADVKTSYLYNLQVYTGKLAGNRPEKNQGLRVVKDLIEPLYNTGRA